MARLERAIQSLCAREGPSFERLNNILNYRPRFILPDGSGRHAPAAGLTAADATYKGVLVVSAANDMDSVAMFTRTVVAAASNPELFPHVGEKVPKKWVATLNIMAKDPSTGGPRHYLSWGTLQSSGQRADDGVGARPGTS